AEPVARARRPGGGRRPQSWLAGPRRSGCRMADPFRAPYGDDTSITDAAWAQGYLRHLTVERGLARNSIASYRRDLAIYADWLTSRGIQGPQSVAEQDLADFVRFLAADRQPPLATSSIARVLSAVRGLHRFLAD